MQIRLDRRLERRAVAVAALLEARADRETALEGGGLDPTLALGRRDEDLVEGGGQVPDRDVAVRVRDALAAAERLVEVIDDYVTAGLVLDLDDESGEPVLPGKVRCGVDPPVVVEDVHYQLWERQRVLLQFDDYVPRIIGERDVLAPELVVEGRLGRRRVVALDGEEVLPFGQ